MGRHGWTKPARKKEQVSTGRGEKTTMDTLRMPVWFGVWKRQHGVSKRSDLDRQIGRKIEAAASKIAEMAAQEPDQQRRRRLVRAARRFAFNWTCT
jgi:hypothetical protein